MRIVFKHNALSFHANARPAAIASMAAARQGKFWEYHDILFENSKALGADQLLGYARIIGLDMPRFEADMKDPEIARKVDNDQAASVAVGSTGTPAFWINGVNVSGAQPFDAFKKEIDAQLEKAKALEGVAREDVARTLTAQDAGPKAPLVVKYFFDEVPAPPVAKKDPPKAKKKPAKPQPEDTTVWKVTVDPETEFIKGPKHAPITIVEFSEFECPFCTKVLPTYKKIQETYGEKVRVIFKHNPLPFHKNAPLASEAALEAGAQGKFWPYHDRLFEAGTKALSRAELETYAEELELDMPRFKKALDEGIWKEKVAADQELATQVNAKGTPNHFINGRNLNGAKPFEEFKRVIDEELGKSQKMLDEGVALEDLYGKIMASAKRFSPLDDVVKNVRLGNSPHKGKAGARIQIVEWSDFECPYCSRVGGPLKQLVSRYPNDVVVGFKQFPLGFHKKAQKAAEAALAADAQGRFWDMHDIMFANQKSLGVPSLKIFAAQLGLDMDRFNADMDGGKYADQVQADMSEGRAIGVRGTPSVYINGRKYSPTGGYTVESLEKVLQQEYGLTLRK